ncbi:MAG TPA: hypothetical protein VE775_07885 [Pyrinomonadaceae bacterium]|nr:hypothetical protein [Pyrinomonadaceae bacterium]
MDEKTQAERDSEANAPDRTAERDDVAEPDAPTATEQNDGMSTILSGDPAEGVQDNAGEE